MIKGLLSAWVPLTLLDHASLLSGPNLCLVHPTIRLSSSTTSFFFYIYTSFSLSLPRSWNPLILHDNFCSLSFFFSLSSWASVTWLSPQFPPLLLHPLYSSSLSPVDPYPPSSFVQCQHPFPYPRSPHFRHALPSHLKSCPLVPLTRSSRTYWHFLKRGYNYGETESARGSKWEEWT